jgi:LacI family transcriptional regulator
VSRAARRRVTVYDLARELGLSPSTVSRALGESELVGARTRAAVRAAAAELGYERRTIRRPGSRAIPTIKLYLPQSSDVHVHLFYDVAGLLAGLRRGFGDVRVNVVVDLNDGSDEAFAAKKTGLADGVVFAFTEADAGLRRRYAERGVPVIHINRAGPGFDFVAVDNALGMATLLERAVGLRGAKRPCYIGFSPVSRVSAERRTGLLSAAAARGIAMGEGDCFEFDAVSSINGAFVRSLRDRGYDAAFCFNDLVAVHVYNRALREGLAIPRDFALTGFDNAPVLDLAPRRIDTIEFPVAELGRRTGAWLKRRLIDRSAEDIRLTLAGAYVPGETIGERPHGGSA